METQTATPLPGIDFAALLRQEGKSIPDPPEKVILAGRPAPDHSPDFRGRAPLPILLSEQDIELVYVHNREYWNYCGYIDISPQLSDWLRRFESGAAVPDAILKFHWPTGHRRGYITLE